jgi:hypothetical protein
MNNLALAWIITLFLLINPIEAKEKIEFSGYGAAGYLFIDRNPLTDANQPTYYMGKLQADIEFNDEIEAQLDLRGNSATNNITFREFSAKFKYMQYLRFKMGHIKRPFGHEYMINREDLPTINRSVMQNNLSLMGYSVRSVSVMAYYNYSQKRPDFPYTYALSIFKDNSLGSGIGMRGLYHFSDFNVGLNYLFQNTTGNYPVAAHGIEIEGGYSGKNSNLNAQIIYVRDPLRSKEIMVANEAREKEGQPPLEQSEEVYSTGAALEGSIRFDTDAKVIRTIEPLILLSFFVPNKDQMDDHILQGLAGVNFYFTKKVRLRLNLDLRLSKSEYDDSGEYATNDSRAIVELHVRF